MQSRERRNAEKAEVRTRILDAARDILLAEGCDALSMRKLAARIGYTATALYFHFPDKDSLLAELVGTDFLKFRRSFSRLEKVADPLERLRRMGHAFVDFGLKNPGHYRLMFMTLHTTGKDPRDNPVIEHGNPDQDAYALLRATVAECLAAGRFRPDFTDVELLTQVFLAGTHGLVSMHLIKGDQCWVQWRPIRARARVMVDALIRGLTLPDPPGRLSCARDSDDRDDSDDPDVPDDPGAGETGPGP